MKSVAVVFGVVMALCAAPVFSTVLVDEQFSHADGGLAGVTPQPGPGGVWAAHSGAGNKAIQVSAGSISLDQSGGSGEDVNTTFAPMAAGEKLYAGFDVMLPSGQTVNPDADGLYFAHFRVATTFRGRVFVVSPTAGGDFGIALDADSSVPSVVWSSDLSFDTIYRIIVSYDFDTGDSQLWIDATLETDSSISDAAGTAAAGIDSFAFRQSSDYTGSQVIDNLMVSDVFDESVPVELMSFSVE
jgi:hypothetical protein